MNELSQAVPAAAEMPAVAYAIVVVLRDRSSLGITTLLMSLLAGLGLTTAVVVVFRNESESR